MNPLHEVNLEEGGKDNCRYFTYLTLGTLEVLFLTVSS